MSSAGGGGPTPPRKGAYSKHVQALHKDQFGKLQGKNSQEINLLEDIRTFAKQKAAIEKHYADALLKLTHSHLNHRLTPIPDVQKGEDDQNQEVNVYNIWKHLLQENEKIAKAKLAAIQVFHTEVEKDAKALAKLKQARTKATFEQFAEVQKDLQLTIAELDRTKRLYFEEETGALSTRDKAKDAEERAKGKKKDLKSLFQGKGTLRKHAGILSAKQEELDIRSTGARNDYILSLASANAHQDRYYKHDLQDTMQHLEGDEFYEKISHYLKTISNTELSVVSSMHESFSQLLKESSRISRLYNYECYTKVCPSLGQHITYEHEAPPGDEIRIITPSEHDGGYSLNYEARQSASKLNQSVKTIKAFTKRIKACHYHKSKGLKHEPNDTGGPDLDTKIKELEAAVRNSEIERAKAEARLARLREGGIAVDEYIDAFVTAFENEERNEANNRANEVAAGAVSEEWPSTSEDAQQEQQAQEDYDANEQQQADAGWANGTDWNQSEAAEAAAAPAEASQENWASWDQQQEQAAPAETQAQGEGWASGGGWGSVDQGGGSTAESGVDQAQGRIARAMVIYTFEAQNEDELTVQENEEINVLLDECDEEGWLKAVNASGQTGYVPQNYVELQDEGQANAADQAPPDQPGYDTQTSYDQYGRQESYVSSAYGRQDSYASSGYGRQDSFSSSNYGSQDAGGGFSRQESVTSQGYGGYGQQVGMDPIPEQSEAPSIPSMPPPAMDSDEDSSEEEETESCAPPAGLPPPPTKPPPGSEPPKLTRPPSINVSSASDARDVCKALYDYDATGSDEISFEEGDLIRVLKRCPNGVDDGWWLGEINGKTGLFPSLMVEECSDEGETPDASSMTSPPSIAPPSFAAPPGPPPPPPSSVPPSVPSPPVAAEPTPPAPTSPPAAADSPDESSGSPEQPRPPPLGEVPMQSTISITAASPEEERSKDDDDEDSSKDQQQQQFVTKPAVPCVQVSVDEVPDIPLDENGVKDSGQGGGLDAMEIVVTAPTPRTQSPVEDDSLSLPTYPEDARSNDTSADEIKTEAEPVPPPPPAPEAVAVAAAAAAAEVESSSGAPPLQKADSEVESAASIESGKVIERHSSADSSVSSPPSSRSSLVKPQRQTGPTIEAKTSSSSEDSSEAGGPDKVSSDEEENTESDMPLPPDQLELKQLKKLDSMKESTA